MAELGYSMEEIREIFQSLYLEKKRVLQLEARSKEAEQDLARLKKMLASEEKKDGKRVDTDLYERLLKEKKTLEEDLVENSHTIGRLQQELKRLKKEFDFQSHEEVSLLQKQIVKIRDRDAAMREELDKSRLHAEQLEKGIEYLRAKLSESKTDRSLLQEQLNEAAEQVNKALQEAEKNVGASESSHHRYEEVSNELSAVKQQLEAAKTMVNASRRGYDEVMEQWRASESQVEFLHQEIEVLKKQQIDPLQIEETQKLFEQEKKMLIEMHREELEGYARARRHLEEEIGRHLAEKEELACQVHEKEKIKGKIIEFEARLNESEGNTKLAQQHLAKKLKEITILQDELEKEKGSKVEAERKLNVFRTQVKELETNLDISRRREEEWRDHKRSQETEQQEWNKKILELTQQIDKHKQRISTLENIEKKYNQLSQFFQGPVPVLREEILSKEVSNPSASGFSSEEAPHQEPEPAPLEATTFVKPLETPTQTYNYHFFDHE